MVSVSLEIARSFLTLIVVDVNKSIKPLICAILLRDDPLYESHLHISKSVLLTITIISVQLLLDVDVKLIRAS